MPSPYEFSHPFDKTNIGKAAIEDRKRRIARENERLAHSSFTAAARIPDDGDLFPGYEANAWAEMTAEEWAQRCTESTDSGARP